MVDADSRKKVLRVLQREKAAAAAAQMDIDGATVSRKRPAVKPARTGVARPHKRHAEGGAQQSMDIS